MKPLDRRVLLTGAAASLAMPVVARAQSVDYDVIVVGAGAAGIAAARRIQAAGRRVIVLEAADRIGGRCFTDAQALGIPFDRGAAFLFASEINPLAKLAPSVGVDVRRLSPLVQLRIGRRAAREGEIENHLAALLRAKRAIAEGARGERDAPALQFLPKDLGDWRASAEFALGPLTCGKELSEISAKDFARVSERDAGAICAGGLGALVNKLAQGLTVRLSSSVTRIATWRNTAYVETTKGALQGRLAIVTASTNVLASGKIKFEPPLPAKYGEAFSKLALGANERIVLELSGNPLSLKTEERVVEQAKDERTAALIVSVGANSLACVDIGGKFARTLTSEGPAAMRAFAAEWLASLFGEDLKKTIGRVATTQWSKDGWTMGSMSMAAPGAQGLRRALTEPFRDRVYFAGEATHETLGGTVAGAWEAGEQAADAALKRFGPPVRRR